MQDAIAPGHTPVGEWQLAAVESVFTAQGQEGLYAVLAGALTVREKDDLIHLRRGELLFVRRGTCLLAPPGQACRLLWLSLEAPFVQAFMQRHGADLANVERCSTPGMNVLLFRRCAALEDCVARLAALQEQRAPSMLAMLRMEELLTLLIFSPQGAALLAALRQQGSRHAHRMHAFMEENFLQEWRLDQYAKAYGLGLTAFKTMFHALYNCSPRAWISERRIVHAHNLLLNTHKSIIDIAMESGFSSQSYFSQSYRRRFGRTPSDARRSPAPATFDATLPITTAVQTRHA